MRILLIVLILMLCTPAYAQRVESVMILDNEEEAATVTSNRLDVNARMTDGTDDALVTTEGELHVTEALDIPSGGEFRKVSATDVNFSHTLKANTKYVTLYNADTVNEIYASITGTTAYIHDWEIPAGYTLSLEVSTASVACICDLDEDGFLYIYVTHQN